MNDKSYVGLGFTVCPICGEKDNSTVLLDKRLKKSLERENFMGYENCSNCAKKIEDGYMALVESDSKVATNVKEISGGEVSRTGRMAWFKRSAWKGLFEMEIPPEGTPMVYVELGVLAMLNDSYEKQFGVPPPTEG